jgi:DNA-binding beta-propeller fold protein YncE
MSEGPRRTTLLYLASAGIALLTSTASCSDCEKGAGGGSGAEGAAVVETTPGKPLAIPQARAAYVTNNGSDSIGVIDRDSEGGVDAVPIDLDPDAHEAPHHLAIDTSSRALFVALAFPPDADASKKKKKDPHASHGNAGNPGKLARLDLATLAVKVTREVDENPGDVVLTHDRSRVLVTHFDMKRAMDVAARGGGSPATMFAELLVLDARDLKKLGGRPICVAPHGVATTKDDRTAFVACYGSDELAVVDLSAPGHALPTSRHPLGASPGVPGVPRYGPYSATLSPDEALVVVADVEGQDVRVWDRAKKVFVPDKTVPLSAKAFMPAFVGPRALLVPTQAPDGLARIDLDTARVVKRVPFDKKDCMLPHVVAVANDGRAYLVCEGDHAAPGTVLEIDPESLATKKKWTVGVYPDGIAFGAR